MAQPSVGFVDLSVINGDIIVKDGVLQTLDLQVPILPTLPTRSYCTPPSASLHDQLLLHSADLSVIDDDIIVKDGVLQTLDLQVLHFAAISVSPHLFQASQKPYVVHCSSLFTAVIHSALSHAYDGS